MVDRAGRRGGFTCWPRVFLLLAMFGPALASCSADRDPNLFCPRLIIVNEADTLSRFRGEGRDLTDVVYQAAIGAQISECDFDEELLEVPMLVSLRVAPGPADVDRRAAFTYFVAIADADRRILARREFDVQIALPDNQAQVETVDEIIQKIPLTPGQTGLEYFIFVGLALTPEELEYNRKNQ